MNTQMMEQLFVESYIMMNLEITFPGVRSWFDMVGMAIEDAELFKTLLFHEQIRSEIQSEITRMIVYRHEDVFFQVNRTNDTADAQEIPVQDTSDPVHQLLIRLMNVRSLKSSEDALIDLGVALQKDRVRDIPLYPSLHGYFQG